MQIKSLLLLAALAFAAATDSLHAQTTIFTDSFESPVLGADDTFTSFNMPNWNKTGGAGGFGVEQLALSHFTAGQPRATDGLQVGFSNGGSQQFTQSLTGPNSLLTASTKYTLSIDIGDRIDTNFTGYQVRLYAGSTQVAFDNNTVSVPDGGWATSTVSYTSSAADPLVGQTLKIEFDSLTAVQQGAETGAQTIYDNVKLTATPAPEPSAMVLALVGSSLFTLRRTRQQAK